jgi:BlaI family penicillinase repressor
MKTPPRISETEWKIMQVLWLRAPLTAAEILEALRCDDSTWHPKTAQTLIGRLVKKGALGFEGSGRNYRYHPRVKADDCVGRETESFLKRVFGGSLQPMLAHFIEHRKLSPREIKELRKILEGDQP